MTDIKTREEFIKKLRTRDKNEAQEYIQDNPESEPIILGTDPAPLHDAPSGNPVNWFDKQDEAAALIKLRTTNVFTDQVIQVLRKEIVDLINVPASVKLVTDDGSTIVYVHTSDMAHKHVDEVAVFMENRQICKTVYFQEGELWNCYLPPISKIISTLISTDIRKTIMLNTLVCLAVPFNIVMHPTFIPGFFDMVLSYHIGGSNKVGPIYNKGWKVE